jgi:hypothetical protein
MESIMSRKLAIVLIAILIAMTVWSVLSGSHSFSIVVNGQPVTGPLKGAIGAGGLVVALIAGFCAAIMLLFVFAGYGIVVLGFAVFSGLIAALVAFPFMLPLLIPLAIVWLFVAITRKSNPPS